MPTNQIRMFFRLLTAKYNDRDAPTTDRPDVISEWRRLEEFVPNSPEYLSFLASLLGDSLYRKATTSLESEDATVVLDILAGVLDHDRNRGSLSNRTLSVLRSLAFNACQVPNHYKVDRSLGYDVDPTPFASGGFSEVLRGNLGSKAVAVKVLRMTEDTNVLELQKHFCKEVVLWKNISHRNILGLIAVEIDSLTGRCSMISELMENGNIFNFIQDHSGNRLGLLADAAEGLHYLHEHKIIHGDIKGSNILITNGTPPRACLCDFGFSILSPMASFSMSTRGMNPFGGTTPYMAPELIYPIKFGLKRSQLSKEGDIYAIGMVVYEVVTGVRPFGLENFREQQMVYAILDGMRPEKPENAEDIGFGRGIWEMVEKCWNQDRTRRPDTGDLRRRLTLAASWSSPVPPGRTIALPQTPDFSTHIELFNNTREPATPVSPYGGFDEEGDSRGDTEDTRSIFERSMSVAKLITDGINSSILPTVREKFGRFDRLHLRRLIDNFRARFDFEPTRTPHLHQD